MAITVRPAGAGDRAVVGCMLGEFIEYLNAIEASEEQIDLDAVIDLGFGPAPVCKTLVAERDGMPVGYVSFHPGIWEIYRAIHVVSLFVRTEARGSGAGRALMDEVKAFAREQQAKRVVWEVWRKNPPAIDFYESIGAEVFEENLRMSLVVE
jgi:GNAT superfamily N-acetyltransferase